MKKINYLILSIFLLFFVNGCGGYKPIFGSTNVEFKISDYSIEGDKIIGNNIYSKLHNFSKSKKDNIRSIGLLISTSKDKKGTSKDSAGKILEYKITLNTKVEVTDFLTGDKLLNRDFTYSLTYKVQDQYSDTVNLEKRSIDSLVDKTYQEILIELSQNITKL